MVRHDMILYDGWTLYDIKTRRRKKATQEGWGKCAPTHTRKNRGRLPPPSVRATRRHADSDKRGRNWAYKRPFDTSRTTSRQRQKNTTRGHTRRHKAKEGRRATGATTKGHRATTSPAKNRQERPPTSGHQKTASGRHQNAERATLRHHAHALTHHERRRICTRTRAQRV